MASLDYRRKAVADGETGSTTGVAATTATANSAAAMGAAADAIATLPEYSFRSARAGTSTVVAITRSGITGAPISTGRSTATAAMVVTTTAGTALTKGTTSQADKKDKTQEIISLPSPKANLAKDLHKNPTD